MGIMRTSNILPHRGRQALFGASLGPRLRLTACLLGVGLCLAAGAARAGDDEEDNSTFEERLVRNIMSGIGGTNMDSKGIDYRERSPLVVPRNLDLPPPESATAEKTPANWPKDPSIAARKAEKEAANQRKADMFELNRPLTPAELAPKRTKSVREATTQQPGSQPDAWGGTGSGPMLSPSQLGFSSGMWSGIFKGGNTAEVGQFKGEPTREDLTQPPTGYQTPSPTYAYGTGPAKPIDQQGTNVFDPNMQQKPN